MNVARNIVQMLRQEFISGFGCKDVFDSLMLQTMIFAVADIFFIYYRYYFSYYGAATEHPIDWKSGR